MPNPIRPVVFIGSSSEGLAVAQAIQVNLEPCAETILWNQGVFKLGEASLESLVNRLSDFDFAILVLTPDDLTISRGDEAASPRDNVMFELGLFMGALGRSRSFIVNDRTAAIKLPSDLAGITAATYQPPSKKGSLASALGPCTTRIQAAIQAQGLRTRPIADSPIEYGVQFQVLADVLEINAHQFIILMHEAGATLNREGPYMVGVRYQYADNPESPRSLGNGYFKVDDLCQRLADADILEVDLRNRVTLSKRGHSFAEWLIEHKYKFGYFWSEVGTWGERPKRFPKPEDASTAPRNIFELHARSRQLHAATKAAQTRNKKKKPRKD